MSTLGASIVLPETTKHQVPPLTAHLAAAERIG